ncbi:MAG: sulfur oxidation c-type cytochrome SoxX [Burkholderiales bacterium]|nr:sulfur oxidation c-type cytochrome SoxX [Burkholderiales bacterium]OJX05232.1 MAG: sulfur oxidation c-type cytochrome SoxX [Burkholderiales bacterium 70-64]
MRSTWQYTLAGVVLVAGCAGMPGSSPTVSDAEVLQTLKASFKEHGIARLDRLDQSDLQQQCSRYATAPLPKDVRDRIAHDALASVKYPADGKYLGNWKEGEKIAQSGRGLQYNDTEKTVAGGNCYACHQLSKAEIAYGNIGPSLYNYGKLRGDSEATRKYTWVRIWNGHAYAPCNNMPRFGAAGILTEAQLKDVMALLLDPASPVNQ